MNESIKFITKPDGEYQKKIVKLWEDTFGDSEKYILSVISSDFYSGMAYAECNGELLGMAHLLRLESGKKAYYCYAVATAEEHRGKGICKNILDFLKEKCKEENSALLLHPADDNLAAFYKRHGFQPLSYTYGISCQGDGGAYFEISSAEYKLQRDFQFGDAGYYGWSEQSLKLSGLRFIGFELDGEYMCAAVSGRTVCEICAPPHMMGKAARRAANSAEKVLMFDFSPVGADVAVMGYNVFEYNYFNLFLD